MDELLTIAAERSIVLEVRDDRLHVEAPRGAMTAELRAALAAQKAALMARLRAAVVVELVTLRGGVTVPWPALQLALALEGRGCRFRVSDGELVIAPASALTVDDHEAIRMWRTALMVIVQYDADAHGGRP